MKALDGHAEGRLAVHLANSNVIESDGKIAADAMISALLADQEMIAGAFSQLAEVAQKGGDILTEDLAIERGRVHEKFAWMLRAHLR